MNGVEPLNEVWAHAPLQCELAEQPGEIGFGVDGIQFAGLDE